MRRAGQAALREILTEFRLANLKKPSILNDSNTEMGGMGHELVAGCCEHGYEPSYSIKYVEHTG